METIIRVTHDAKDGDHKRADLIYNLCIPSPPVKPAVPAGAAPH
jgi:hypothetical protein